MLAEVCLEPFTRREIAMRLFPSVALVILLFAVPAAAEQASWLPGTAIGHEPILRPLTAVTAPGDRREAMARGEHRRHPKYFAVLATARAGAALFDAWSTRRALARGATARELNPLMRPIAENPAALYGVLGGLAALQIWIADRQLHRGDSAHWGLVLGTTVHGVCGALNLRF
jgi:hypothetical protein